MAYFSGNASGLHVVSHPDYDITLPEGHRFRGGKFTAILDYVIRQGFIKDGRVSQPRPVDTAQLAMVHDPGYISAIREGGLDKEALRQLGLPWSEQLAKRSHLAVEGTYKTCIKALEHGLACHAAGGTHHAHWGHGAGFCVFNDMAYAGRRLVAEGLARRVLILDCDVHQGDGTARILSGDHDVVTASLHCQGNYPYDKAVSDYDIVLDDGMDDAQYLHVLAASLEQLAAEVRPDLVIYDAGIDVHRDDVLGRLAMTAQGISAREDMVLGFWGGQGVPVATVIGGGYTHDFAQMVALHGIIFDAAAARMRKDG